MLANYWLYFSRSLLCLLSLFFSLESAAFGNVGHQAICQLSFNHLSQSTQTKVSTLLSQIPTKHQQLVNRYNHLPKNSNITFATACTWADAIKADKRYNKFKPWHYVNVARSTIKVTAQVTAATCRTNCLPRAITYHLQQLQSATNTWQKLQALMFLGHWLGDIHQPLHVSFTSDRGGNKTRVKSKNSRCRNLHALWDNCFFKNSKKYKADLRKKLERRWRLSDAISHKAINTWQWATESLTLVRTPAFNYCQLRDSQRQNSNNKNECSEITPQPLVLASNYHQHFMPVAEQQLLKAALRLTQLLEKSL